MLPYHLEVLRLYLFSFRVSLTHATTTTTDAFGESGFIMCLLTVVSSCLQDLLSQDGVADVFRRQTISVSNSNSCSRTFYMIAPSNEEKSAWVDAIQNNIGAHAVRMM